MYRVLQTVLSKCWFSQAPLYIVASLFLALLPCGANGYAQSTDQMATEGDPLPSVGSEIASEALTAKIQNGSHPNLGALLKGAALLQSTSGMINLAFEGFGFDDNQTENINPVTGNGVRFIPPDPIGAAGKSRIIAVVNTMIEERNKGGALMWRDGLKDFFAPVSPTTFTFDPKIVYDHYADRFVVVALEQVAVSSSANPGNISRILLAVSKNGNPKTPTAADWYYHAINSKTVISGFERWADYPGFEADEEALYITANMFRFVANTFGGVRLWIVDKGAGTGGFYDGGPAVASPALNPYASGGIVTTTMPAQVHGVTGAGSGIGTYLVSYSGLSDGVDEYVQIVRVNNPLGAVSFTQEFLNIGNIEDLSSFPNAPQSGSSFPISVNDRRALDAVWRDNQLWLTTTINPFSGPDAGQATAHWWNLNTSAVTSSASAAGLITLDQQGDIGGEDIAPGTFTFFPSVAVNRNGHAMFGFSASAPTIYAGAYVTGREAGDPPGTVQASLTVKAGEAPYKRFFSGTRNRWGDYSGISVDPTNEDFFWVFNEFADEQGNPTNGSQGLEDGRWGTAWARAKFQGTNLPKSEFTSTETPPSDFVLSQNYPNPFNPTTQFTYELPEAGNVVISIFNIEGQLVRTLVDEFKTAGYHNVAWEGRDMNGSAAPSGSYFYRIKTAGFEQSRRMILLK